MNKIAEIFTAWKISFNPNDNQSELAANRMEICDACEYKRTSPVMHCGICGCALRAKVFSLAIGACPKGKWNEVDIKWNETQNKLKK